MGNMIRLVCVEGKPFYEISAKLLLGNNGFKGFEVDQDEKSIVLILVRTLYRSIYVEKWVLDTSAAQEVEVELREGIDRIS